MKIFIVTPSLGIGGAERVGALLAQGFCDKGHDVKVFTNLDKRKDYVLSKNIETINIGFLGSNKFAKWIKSILLIRKFLKENKPDVIVGIMSLYSLFSYIAAVRLRIPVIETIHSSLEKPKYAPMSLWEKFYKFYLSRIYDKVTILTESDKRESRLRNVVVMPNPLAIAPTSNIIHRNSAILAAGRIDDWHYKGFDLLIRAWNEVEKSEKLKVKSEGWKLQIAGTGSEKSLNYLKQLCKQNGVENSVEFLGFRKDVENLYQDASIFVLSSRYEGFGLVLIEAMSQGCACIACDYKGRQREIMSPTPASSFSDGLRKRPVAERPRREEDCSIESPSLGTRNLKQESRNNKVEACETGILCETDDVEALAEAMKKMIMDEEYRESVRMNAIERSKYYSLENTIDRWEKLLDEVVN